jgi:hypothetical protein
MDRGSVVETSPMGFGTRIAYSTVAGGESTMIWMLLGVGTLLPGASASASKDSAGLAELRSHLPEDLRLQVEKARKAQRNRHDTLALLSPAEKNRWLDSLRQEATTRRTQMLNNLTPDDRARMEMSLQDMEHQIERKPREPQSRDPNQGYRQ